jgi:hypothetical protein
MLFAAAHESVVGALFGLGAFARRRLLVGVERTLIKAATISGNGPKATLAGHVA